MKRELIAALSPVLITCLMLAALITGLPSPLSGQSNRAEAQAGYGWLRVEQVVVSGTGTAGAVNASARSSGPVEGHIYALHLDFAPTISTTTDITITQASPPLTVLQLTDFYTDTWFYPAAQRTNSAGSTLADYDRVPAYDRLTVAAGQTISGTVVTATVYYGE